MLACLLLLATIRGPQVGANVPWTTYEVEQMQTTGEVLGPDYSGFTVASEASGRRCVRLTAGQTLRFKSASQFNGVVIRYSLPPSQGGADQTGALVLKIGNRTYSAPVTNHFLYQYGDYPFSKDPSKGHPRHFWDETHTLVESGSAGQEITLSLGQGLNEATIDLVDLESVAPPIKPPKGAVSVADMGAIPNGTADCLTALQSAVKAAKEKGVPVWFPQGTYVVGGPLKLDDATIEGAGMWYTTLKGVQDYKPENRVSLEGAGSHIQISDLAIDGNLNYRNDSEANDGLGGSFGTGSSIRNVWVEHTKTGAWLENSDGLEVSGCRFRDTIADGINLCVGMKNTTVLNCSARGTGDDCFAMWPATYHQPTFDHGHNAFERCTAQLPYLAQGFAIYGGDSNRIEDCAAQDIPYGAGALISTTFPTAFGFRGMTVAKSMTITRAGMNDGAFGIFCNRLPISGIEVADVTILNAIRDGLKFVSLNNQPVSNTHFQNLAINGAGIGESGYGIAIDPKAQGAATIENVKISNAKSGNLQTPPSTFSLTGSPNL